jgi:transcriptional regulator with XRE-family HTH domain
VSTPNDSETLPARHYLKEWRLKRALTQLQLAQRLNTSKSMISRYERGGRTMTLLVQFRIMRALDIKPAQFFMHPDEPATAAYMLLDQITPAERERLVAVLRGMLLDPKG